MHLPFCICPFTQDRLAMRQRSMLMILHSIIPIRSLRHWVSLRVVRYKVFMCMHLILITILRINVLTIIPLESLKLINIILTDCLICSCKTVCFIRPISRGHIIEELTYNYRFLIHDLGTLSKLGFLLLLFS